MNSLIGKKKLGEYGNVGIITDIDYLGLGWVTIDFGLYEIKTWEWDFEDAPIHNNMLKISNETIADILIYLYRIEARFKEIEKIDSLLYYPPIAESNLLVELRDLTKKITSEINKHE